MITKLTKTCVLFLGITTASFAQDIDKEKLDSYFETLNKNNKFMGSVAISKNNKIIYSHSTGFADVVSKQANNANTKYLIGSVSKMFTATLILKANELKKLDINQPIATYFPNLKNANKITISHLLYHRSGIHNFTDEQEFMTYYTQKKSRTEMLDIISKYATDFEPDTKASYSNSNYVLLSYILEDAFKDTYASILNKYIASPLKLKSTYLASKIDLKKNEANSYSFQNEWIKEQESDISIPLGAGGIVSTPTDLITFIESLFNEKIISKASLDKMLALKDNYGMGIFSAPFNDEIGYIHNGRIDGFDASLGYFPTSKIAISVLSNASNIGLNDIGITMLSAAHKLPITIPNFEKRKVTSQDLDVYLGTYKSEQIPLKITVTKQDNVLYAQATGQGAFPIDALENDQFSFDAAGILLEFNTKENSFILNQGGGKFKFVKE